MLTVIKRDGSEVQFDFTKIIQAIKKDRFEIFAQSISNQNDKKYEILVRMKDTKGEIVSPYFFIDRAKKINLYGEITKKVVQKSFEFFEGKNTEFSINLSISDILEKDILKKTFLDKMIRGLFYLLEE